LGIDTKTTNSSTPVSVSGLSGVTAIALGRSHSCALTSGGGVKCWGENEFGQLGDNTTNDTFTPVDVDLSDVTAIALGGSHSCAITGNNKNVKCWGLIFEDLSGNATTTNASTPVFVKELSGMKELSGVTDIALGGSHSCAITGNKNVKCWGLNTDGQLGNSTMINSSKPVSVNLSGVTVNAIGLGDSHSCAMTSDNDVKCWGLKIFNSLGNFTTYDSSTPVENLSDGVVAAIALGDSHSCAITSDNNDVKCWGKNSSGQLGNNTQNDSDSPVEISIIFPLSTGQKM
jgi:alpha-tubulin suppressor-like RCC1 family protein